MIFSFSARSTMYLTCSFVRIKWQLQLPLYKGANHFKGIYETLSRPGLSIPLTPWNKLSRRTAKPTNWPGKWGLRSIWASTLSDQSSLSARRNLGSVATHRVHSEDSDQTVRMPRLICVFAVHTYHFVCFVLLRLNCFVSLLLKIKIVISYVPCSPKLSLCPCSPSFSDLSSLVPLK